jgi:hypothetical protein
MSVEERDRVEVFTRYGMGGSFRGVWDCLIEVTGLRQDALQGLRSA